MAAKVLLSLKVLFVLLLVASKLAIAQEEFSLKEKENILQVKIRTVQHMAFNPVIVNAVRQQNAQNLSLATIQQRDEEWKTADKLTPFKRSLQNSKAGKLLKRHVTFNDSFNEAFLTDNQGANVAAYPATSDYWQGDEEKWIKSFNNGNGKIFIGPIEEDESTQTAAVQISAPILDQGATIGVLVIGITLDYVESKKAGKQ